MQDKIDNSVIPLEQPTYYIIDKDKYITTQLLKKRTAIFYDVNLIYCGEKNLIGRYLKDFDNIFVSYNKGKVLVYSKKEENSNDITVLDLYNIGDDMIYSVTPEEALKIFDDNKKNIELNVKDGCNKELKLLKRTF